MEQSSSSDSSISISDSVDTIQIENQMNCLSVDANTCHMPLSGLSSCIVMNKLNTSAVKPPGVGHVKKNTFVNIEAEPVIQYEMESLVNVVQQKRLLEKVVYMLSIASIILLTHSILEAAWLLPYYYTVSAPLLFSIRTIMYCNYKWQYFLLEFCYLGLIMLLVFIWALPQSPRLFAVVFALSNGPLLWAVAIYRNSFVFHSIDKVTSVFIHFFPAMLCFVIRWKPAETSKKWYVPFVSHDWETSLIWLVVVPVICLGFHNCVYNIVVYVLLKPSEDHITSFKYFITKKETDFIVKAFSILGSRWRIFMYNSLHLLVSIVSMFFSLLWYHYFIAHCIFLGSMFFLSVYNGANYYMHIFSVRGFSSVRRQQQARSSTVVNLRSM